MGHLSDRRSDVRPGEGRSTDPRDARLSFTPRDDGRARLLRRIVLPVATLLVALLIMLWPRPSTRAPDPARDDEVRALVESLIEDARLGRRPATPIGASEPIISDLVRGHLVELMGAGVDDAISVEVVPAAEAERARADPGAAPLADDASHVATIARGSRRIELRIDHRGAVEELAIVGIEIRAP